MSIFDRLFRKQPQTVAWETWEPDHRRTPEEEHPVVNLEDVVLLVPEQVMAQNTTADELAQLVQAAEHILRDSVTHVPDAFGLRLRFTLYPDKPIGLDLGVNIQKIDREVLQRAYDAVNSLPEMQFRAKHQPVALHAHFRVNTT